MNLPPEMKITWSSWGFEAISFSSSSVASPTPMAKIRIFLSRRLWAYRGTRARSCGRPSVMKIKILGTSSRHLFKVSKCSCQESAQESACYELSCRVQNSFLALVSMNLSAAPVWVSPPSKGRASICAASWSALSTVSSSMSRWSWTVVEYVNTPTRTLPCLKSNVDEIFLAKFLAWLKFSLSETVTEEDPSMMN